MRTSRELLFSLCFVTFGTTAASAVQVFAYIGGEANVSCSYPHGYESYDKYLCTVNCGGHDVLVTTTQGRRNRYSISDDKESKIFTITISSVAQSDAGKYWCAVSKNGKDIYTEVKVHVLPDVCCDSVHSVQAFENDSVSMSCSYKPELVNSFKYMCRGSHRSTCRQQALVTTNMQQNDRFKFRQTQSEFTVELTGVTEQDAGSYLCGVQRDNNFDVFSRIDLTVTEWCCVNSREVKGLLGQSVTLQCPYPAEHRSNRKFLCKGEHRNTCETVVTSTGPTDRFRLQDGHSSSFSVTVAGLRETDSGTYWCGSDSQWTPGKNYTKVQLSLEWCCVNSREVKGLLGQSVTLQCPYPAEHRSNRKFLCRGEHRNTCETVVTSAGPTDRFQLQDGHSSSFSVTVAGLRESDSGTYWCGSDSQWTPGKIYTKVQLSLEYFKSTVSPKQTTNPSGSTLNKGSDAVISHVVMYVLPGLLLILVVVTSVIVYKYSCVRAQGDRESNNISRAKEDIAVRELYSNQEVMKSSRVNAYRHGDDRRVSKDEVLYENFSNENIYNNC